MIEATATKNEIEGAMAVQMACPHIAATVGLARFGGGRSTDRRAIAFATAAARLLKANTLQVEALRRLRGGGQQYVRVEHVHVNDGGQAIIGNVKTPPGSPGDSAVQ
jgi:hypothetical protein